MLGLIFSIFFYLLEGLKFFLSLLRLLFLMMNFLACFTRSKGRLAPFDFHLTLLSFSPHNSRVLAWIWGRVKYIYTILNSAIIKDSVKVLKNLCWLKIRNYLPNTENQFSSIGLNFILFLNLIKTKGSVQFLPVSFGQFKEIIEYEIKSLGHTPSVSEKLVLKDFYFISKNH